MSASDAMPVPRKNVAFRLYFAFRDDNNDLVTSWGSSPTLETSTDGGTMTGVTPTNISEIATNSGCGYVDLGSSTMNCDCLVVKLGLSGANDVVIILYPEEIGDYRVRVEKIAPAASGDIAGAVWDADENDHTTLSTFGYYVPKIEDDVGAIHTEIGLDGVSLTNLPWNADWDTQVQSEVYDALNEAIPGSPTANSIFERVKAVDDKVLGTLTGDLAAGTHNPQSGDTYSIVNNGTYGNAALETIVDTMEADIKSHGDTNWLTATGFATPTNITAGTITTVTNLTNAPTNGDLTATMKASVQGEAEDALETYHLDHLLAVDYDPASPPGVSTALLNELVESDGGVARFTANTLEEAPTGDSAPTVGAIADAVWTEVISTHATTGGSAAHALVAASGNLFGVNVIEIDGDPVDLTTASEVADAVWDESISGHTTTGSAGDALIVASGNLIGSVSAATIATAVWDKDISSYTSNAGDYLKHMFDNYTTTRAGYIDNLNGHTPQTGDSYAIVNDGTYGNAALETIVDTMEVDIKSYGDSNWTTATSVTVSDKTGFSLSAAGIDAIWDEPMAAHTTGGTFGDTILDNLNATVSSRSSHTAANVYTAFGTGSNLTQVGLSTTALNNVNAEVDTALGDYDGPTKAEMDSAFTEIKGSTWSSSTDTLEDIRDEIVGLNDASAASIADAVWNETLSDHDTPGSTGHALVAASGNLFGVNVIEVNGSPATEVTANDVADAVWDEQTSAHRTAGSAGMGLITASGNLIGGASGPDAATIATAVWDKDVSGYTSNAGDYLKHMFDNYTTTRAGYIDNLNGHTPQTGDSYAIVDDGTYGNAALETIVDTMEVDIKSYGDSNWTTATSVTVSDKTGFSLSAAGIDAIWDEPMAAHTTGGTFGDTILDNLNTTVSSRSSHSAADVWTAGSRSLSTQDWSTHSAADVWTNGTRTLTAGTNLNDLDAGEVATAVWDAATATYGSAGSYGLLIETNLDTTVGSRSSHTAANVYTAFGTGSNLTAVGLSTTALNNVNAEVDTALGDYDGPTDAEMTAAFTEIKGAGWTSTDTLEGIWTDTNEIVSDLNSLITDIGSNGVGLTAIPWNSAWDTSVESAVWDATLSSYDTPGSTGHALVVASGNLIGSEAGPDANTIATAVWDKNISAYTTGAGDYLKDLFDNQGDWATATGFATATELAKVPKSDGSSSWNATALAAIQGEAEDALETYHLDHLLAVAESADVVTNSVIAKLASDNATWSGFNYSTDSLEAIRLRGDSAWDTATGFSTLTEADIRTAVGLASANLDTQLGDIPTVSEFNARTLVAASYFDPAVDTVANVTTVATTTDLTNLPTMPTDWITATGLSAGAVTEIEDGVWTRSTRTLTAGTNLNDLDAGEVATAVWDAATADHRNVGSTGLALITASGNLISGDWSVTGEPLTQAEIRSAVGLASADLDTQLGDIPTVSEFNARTLLAASYFDPAADTVANVTTVATTTNLTNLPTMPTDWITSTGLSAGAVTEIEDGVWTRSSRTLTASTNFNDLDAGEIATAVWDAATATYGSAGSYGLLVETNLDTTIGSRSSHDAAAVYTAFGTGSNLTQVGLSTTALNNVNAEVDTALGDYDGPTKTEMDSAFTEIKGSTWSSSTDTLEDIRDEIVGLNDPTSASIADAVWDESIANHDTPGSTGHALVVASGNLMNSGYGGPSLADIADAVWDEDQDAHTTADTFGYYMYQAYLDTNETVGDLNSLITDIGSNGAGLTNLPWNSSWDSEVQSEVTNALNSYDPPTKTEMDSGFSGLNDPTTSQIADAVWDEAIVSHDTPGTTGHALVIASGNLISGDWGDATASNQTAIIGYVDGIEAKTNNLPSDPADASVIAAAFTSLESHGDSNWATATSVTVSDKTGFSLSAAGIDAIWDEPMAAHTTGGTFGDTILDNLNATVSSRSSHSDADVWTAGSRSLSTQDWSTHNAAAVVTALDTGSTLTAIPWNANWDAEVQSECAEALTAYDPPTKTEMDSGFSGLNDPTSAAIADAVWNETLSDHVSAGSTGQALVTASGNLIGAGSVLTEAGIADAVWNELVTGHDTVNSYGDIVHDYLDASVSTRSTFDHTSDTVANVTTVATTTNLTNLPTIPTNWLTADGLAADAVTEIEDGVWTRSTRTLTAGTNLNDLSSSDVATAVWDAATATYGSAGSYGLLVETNLDTTVSSRSSHSSADVWTAGSRSLSTQDWSTHSAADVWTTGGRTLTTQDWSTHSAADVWTNGTRTLTAGTNLNDISTADVWGYATRTVTNLGDAAVSGDVRGALGLVSANLDTQLGDIPTVSEFNARTLVAASYFDPAADTVANVTTVATTTNLTNLPTMPTDWLTSTGLATSAVNEIVDQVWDETVSDHVGAGSTGQALVTASGNLIGTGSALTEAGIADAVWNELSTDHTDAGKAGAQLWTDIDAILSDTDDLQTNQGDWLTATSVTVSDKTGFSLSTAGIDAIWDEPMAAHTTGGTFGDTIQDNLNATVSSRSSHSAADVWTTGGRTLSTQDWSTHSAADVADIVGASGMIAQAVWEYGSTRALTTQDWSTHSAADVWTASGRSLSGTISDFDALDTALDSAHGAGSWATATSVTVSDKTGFSLSAAGIDDIWTENVNDHADTANSVAHALVTASGNLMGVNLTAVNGVDVTTYTEQEIVDAVWDEPVGDHQIAGSTGEALVASGVITPAAVWAYSTRELSGTISDFDALDTALDSAHGAGDWITATGFALAGDPLTQAEIRSAIGMSSANLDTQLGDIPTVSEFNARTLVAASYFDPAADTVANVTTVGSVTGNVGGIVGTINDFDGLKTDLETTHGTGSWESATPDASGDIAQAVWEYSSRALSTQDWSTHSAADVAAITGGSGDIAGAVWDRALGEHLTVDSAGWALGIVASGLAEVNVIEVSGVRVGMDPYVDANTIMVSGEMVTIRDFRADAITIASGDIAQAVWEFGGTRSLTTQDWSTHSAADVADAVWTENINTHATTANSAAHTLITASGNLISGNWSTHIPADVDTTLTSSHGAGNWTTATGFSTHNAAQVADAVWTENINTHATTADSTAHALVTSSGNLIGGAGTAPTATEVANAVWNKQLGEHLTINSAGWALGIVGSGIVDSNTVQVSGEYVTVRDIATGDLDTTGLATTVQLEYWALQILNNCGGGGVG